MNLNKIMDMNVKELIEEFVNYIESKETQLNLYKFINENPINYDGLNQLLPKLDQDDLSIILKYDKDYSISFLLSIVDIAYEDDLTKQAIYLLKRHNLTYIIPLLPYVDEQEIREEYRKKAS